MEHLVRDLFALQGKSERIKNFPYPRQYATLSYDIVRVFVLLLPFGVIPEFSTIGNTLSSEHPLVGKYFIWLGVPFSVIVSWVFNTMQRIGVAGENPFEGSANDVPISTMARTTEIEMREMLGESPDMIPEPCGDVDGATDALLGKVYDELQRVAAAKAAPGQTLPTTVLIHEAWLKIARADLTKFANRRHFVGTAADDEALNNPTPSGGGGIPKLTGSIADSLPSLSGFAGFKEELAR